MKQTPFSGVEHSRKVRLIQDKIKDLISDTRGVRVVFLDDFYEDVGLALIAQAVVCLASAEETLDMLHRSMVQSEKTRE